MRGGGLRSGAWGFLAALALLGVGAAMAPVLERNLTFHPSRTLERQPGDAGLAAETVALATPDGQTIAGWYVPSKTPFATALFLHGNAGNMGDRLPEVASLGQAGFSVLIIDYRGYGTSTGAPSEDGIYLDARAAWDHLVTGRRVPPPAIVLIGESLGSAAALHLAAELKAAGQRGPGAIVLVGAFTNAQEMGRRHFPWLPVRWMLREQLDNLAAVGAIDAPLMLIHGQRDEVVPVEMGRRLFGAAASPVKQLREIPNLGHATLMAGGRPLFHEIERFVRRALEDGKAEREAP